MPVLSPAEGQEQGDRASRLAEMVAAHKAGEAAAPEPEVRLFCIRLMGARYAFEASMVSEAVRLGPLTRLPAAPAFLPGVFAHRGEIIAVLDIAQLLGEAATQITSHSRAAIVRRDAWKLAVLAESVQGLLSVPKSQLDPAPVSGGGVSEFLSGVGRDKLGAFAILDLGRVLEAARARSQTA